ncbi:DUF6005 family protein [Paenibacillus sp. FJAT-26967]|uniref:DUF6005 family protein n=1 Tax=Paenibacillus sp. FJAT-26967 TaxID=1729690 RepID=UPI00083883B5|nr:DUF6005 family protein [Paenibacillus sp. FJAT-26967]
MIKVHCLMSCLCEIIKRNSKVDHRPYYFGIWDSGFSVKEDGTITYYADGHRHDYFLSWYEKFFGLRVHEWYDPGRTRQQNLDMFLQLIADRPDHRHLIVQIDMSVLPERENKFYQKPFPHYLVLSETSDPEEWFMFDPDFRWEGNIRKERVIEAIIQNPFGGGFYVDALNIQAPAAGTIQRYFHAGFHEDINPLTSRIRETILQIASGRSGSTLAMLMLALKQIHILAIRKYSYDYALMVFRDALGYPEELYEYWAQQIRDLVQAFNTIQYIAAKVSIKGDPGLVPGLLESVDKADRIEFDLKKEIGRQFAQWWDSSRKEQSSAATS